MTPKYQVVIDTQVYLRALINRKSAPYRLLTQMSHKISIYTATGMVNEVIDVLNRSKIRIKFPQITEDDVEFIAQMLKRSNHVELLPKDIDAICRDPKDDIFLACAKMAGADYLISEDHDLLVLKQHKSTKIVNVIAMLEILATHE